MFTTASILITCFFTLTSFLSVDEPRSDGSDGYVTLLGGQSAALEVLISVGRTDDGESNTPTVEIAEAWPA